MVELALRPATAVDSAQVAAHSRSYWATVGRRLRKDKVTLVVGGVLLLIVLAALLAPWLAPADPLKTSMIRRLKPIGTAGFPLGTDELGRDMLSRLIWGGRLSLLMGLMPVFNALLLGGLIGVVAGFVGWDPLESTCRHASLSIL